MVGPGFDHNDRGVIGGALQAARARKGPDSVCRGRPVVEIEPPAARNWESAEKRASFGAFMGESPCRWPRGPRGSLWTWAGATALRTASHIQRLQKKV